MGLGLKEAKDIDLIALQSLSKKVSLKMKQKGIKKSLEEQELKVELK